MDEFLLIAVPAPRALESLAIRAQSYAGGGDFFSPGSVLENVRNAPGASFIVWPDTRDPHGPALALYEDDGWTVAGGGAPFLFAKANKDLLYVLDEAAESFELRQGTLVRRFGLSP